MNWKYYLLMALAFMLVLLVLPALYVIFQALMIVGAVFLFLVGIWATLSQIIKFKK